MSITDLLQIFDLATRVLSVVAIGLVWLIARTMVTRAAFEEWRRTIDQRLNKGDTRFAVFDTRPTRTDIDGLRSEIGDMNATLHELCADRGAVKDRLDGIERQVETLVRLQLEAKR